MGHRHRVYPESSLGVIWLDGLTNVSGFLNGMSDLYGDPVWKPGYATLWDIRGITGLDIVPEDIATVTRRMRELLPVRGMGRLAFLVGREIEEEIVLLFLLNRTGRRRPAAIFRSASKALTWLGISDPPEGLLSGGPVT